MERIVALCRRRGFIFGSSEIYGGIGGFWDYGPLGCELKKNIKDVWWEDMVRNPPPGPGGREFQMVGVDCSIIMNPNVWVASGHVGGFSDPMVDCTECKKRFRADKAWVARLAQDSVVVFVAVEAESREEAVQATMQALTARQKKDLGMPGKTFTEEYVAAGALPSHWKRICPACQSDALTSPRSFNLMFETFVGALQDAASKAYLRPETAQGIFANFRNVMDSTRVKIPFGIAQVGKAFRNEINPRNYTFRSREFEQMEIEFFCHPGESRMWYEYWRDVRINWYTQLGIKSDKLRPREQGKEELAHYSCGTTDIEYLFPFSEEPQELEGVAHRGDFDLKAHGKHAKGDENAFAVVDDDKQSRDRQGAGGAAEKTPADRYVPHVIEPSAGADRFTLAVLCEAYSFDESRASPEFMKFHPRLAPIKAAVFPLVAKDGLPEIAEPIFREIKKHYPCQYDAKQSIGKRYARMDEAGTPFCFTIDGQTKVDGTVTVRSRDDASQVRIDKSRCLEYLRERLRLGV
ncbi:MAG: glycine--tRNA ligase [Planctomycetes bacterium]|nr:glycine--tRNA ligase [Planctomycetota bacterium]